MHPHHPITAPLTTTPHGRTHPPHDTHWVHGTTTTPIGLADLEFRSMADIVDHLHTAIRAANNLNTPARMPARTWGVIIRARVHARPRPTLRATLDADPTTHHPGHFTARAALLIPFTDPDHTTLTLAPHHTPTPQPPVTVTAHTAPHPFHTRLTRLAHALHTNTRI